jgi:outer membrane protein assembly factor BamB
VKPQRFGQFTITISFVLTLWCGYSAAKAPATMSGPAGDILRDTGVTGGLVVHIGCGDGKLTAALQANKGMVVHGLDVEAKNVRAARKHITSLGIYGKVSTATFNGKHLPYIDNFVNLIVSENILAVATSEVMRVLAPGGVAYIKTDGRWNKTVKPRPKNIDDWTHYLHGPDNNAVSQDTVAGPPRHLQWVAPPRWARSHEVSPSIQGVVSANGRLFYVHDTGPIGIVDERFGSRWSLIARDAFNGIRLWKRDIGSWGSSGEYWLKSTVTPNRRIVADTDRIYAALGGNQPVTVFDSASGRTLTAYKGTESTRELVCHNGILLAATGKARQGRQRGRTATSPGGVTAINTSTGQRIWRVDGKIGPLSLSILGDAVLFMDDSNVVCVDLKTGARRWHAKSTRGSLVSHKKAILVLHAKGITAHRPSDGSVMWRSKQNSKGFVGKGELFVIDSLVWPGGTGVGLDLLTGEVKRRISIGASPGHHHRCHQRKATVNYLLNSKRGVEFFDLSNKQKPQLHDWVRGNCRLGVVPGNGLLYIPSHACFCYPGVLLKGFNALAPGSVSKDDGSIAKLAKTTRIEKGPAFGGKSSSPVSLRQSDWPTYRHDPARSGRASCKAPKAMKQSWKVKLIGAGRLTPPVVAGGVVYVAGVDTHKVFARNAVDGSRLWSFTAGGRIDSPPTIARIPQPGSGSLCVFGSRDGYVYCLRSSDGKLAWRFRAARTDRKLGAYGQIESVWPVHGSVLVRNSLVYIAAGRSSFIDGGISLYALDLQSGEIRHHTQLHDRPMTVEQGTGSGPMDMLQGAQTDIMVCDTSSIYMSKIQFDEKLKVQTPNSLNPHGRLKTGLHLSATSGFLDDTYFNRSFWMYARVWPGYTLATSAPKSGQILAFDNQTTYSTKVFDRRGPGNHFRSGYFKAGSGYLLCADDNSNEPQQSSRVKGAERARPDQIRQKPAKWTRRIPMRVRAMVIAGQTLLVAGPPDMVPVSDPLAALQGRKGAAIWAVSASDGKTLGEYKLDHPPVFDGMALAGDAIFIVLKSGEVACIR